MKGGKWIIVGIEVSYNLILRMRNYIRTVEKWNKRQIRKTGKRSE